MCAIFTPRESRYKSINILLAAKFVIFITMYEIMLYQGFYGGDWENYYRMGLDLFFAYLFYRLGGVFLALLCISMSIFHLLNKLVPLDYQVIMICFQVLQLMYATWGMSDGIVDKLWAIVARFRPRRNGYN